ncbi:MAG: DNA starvation/stationary phase protection protein [Alphaproteobacteria bacterium]|jgi:starvation-inducible DNA-binding protein|nr:DNA starvation/stationary phase protection protein [Alphaproteobacteria bacterium]
MTSYSLSPKARNAATPLLRAILANTTVLAFKTRHFHWNVEGQSFSPLHALFGEQYEELNDAADELAERLRKIGQYAPTSLKHILESSTLVETAESPKAIEMVRILAEDNAALGAEIHKGIKAAADAGDDATADLLTTRLHAHDKAAWMLRSHLV